MLLSHPAVTAARELLQPEDFYKPAHGRIFGAIASLHEAGQPIDPTTVADRLARAGVLEDLGGKSVLLELQAGTPAAAHAQRPGAPPPRLGAPLLAGHAADVRRVVAAQPGEASATTAMPMSSTMASGSKRPVTPKRPMGG